MEFVAKPPTKIGVKKQFQRAMTVKIRYKKRIEHPPDNMKFYLKVFPEGRDDVFEAIRRIRKDDLEGIYTTDRLSQDFQLEDNKTTVEIPLDAFAKRANTISRFCWFHPRQRGNALGGKHLFYLTVLKLLLVAPRRRTTRIHIFQLGTVSNIPKAIEGSENIIVVEETAARFEISPSVYVHNLRQSPADDLKLTEAT
ncbi:hypothetical protein AJ79_07344 [Helicocarpus griseus UAMH5409]|uniref:Uncharacterized protein n=1 Tax=Helicocarpus griseus UAMH5409 TaxID=1447875 RepID=A0A2B7X3P2_9EURO|nr:hypothetical protein AJ79_07344 [Helicocarpus griseus UAMH5409]